MNPVVAFVLGVVLGLGVGVIGAVLGAAHHVRRVDRISREMSATAEQAKRISLHVSDQYAPLRERLERVEREIEDIRQEIHELINDVPPTGG